MEESEAILLHRRCCSVMPGGVNSPVRAFGAVGGIPRYIVRADGAWLWDGLGARYLDGIGSWGAMLLGHGRKEVVAAIKAALDKGCSFGTATYGELYFAEKVCSLVPSMSQVRVVSSGTEAMLSVLRLVRAVRGLGKVVIFEGGYHGHGDAFLVGAGSGLATLGIPASAGVLEGSVKDTLLARYNDIASVEALFHRQDDIAAVIVEPVAGNMGCIPPKAGFLSALRELCDRHGALLVFDEVMTGFRIALGGAQAHYGVIPDITALGKVVGGGMPVAVYGASEEIMSHVSPVGKMYQAGTLSGHPLGMAAGYATLSVLEKEQETLYPRLEKYVKHMAEGLKEQAKHFGIAHTIKYAQSMMSIFFTHEDVHDFDSAKTSSREKVCPIFSRNARSRHSSPSPPPWNPYLSLPHGAKKK